MDISVVDRVVDESQMVHMRQHGRTEPLAVTTNAAHTHATETYAVVAAFAAYENAALTLAARTVVSQGDLHGCVSGFRAGGAEKHLAQVARGECGNHVCGFKRAVIAKLKRRGIVQRLQLLVYGLVDFAPVMSCAHTPQTGYAVQYFAAVCCREIHAIGGGEHTGGKVEIFVRRERQPQIVKFAIAVAHAVSLLAYADHHTPAAQVVKAF